MWKISIIILITSSSMVAALSILSPILNPILAPLTPGASLDETCLNVIQPYMGDCRAQYPVNNSNPQQYGCCASWAKYDCWLKLAAPCYYQEHCNATQQEGVLLNEAPESIAVTGTKCPSYPYLTRDTLCYIDTSPIVPALPVPALLSVYPNEDENVLVCSAEISPDVENCILAKNVTNTSNTQFECCSIWARFDCLTQYSQSECTEDQATQLEVEMNKAITSQDANACVDYTFADRDSQCFNNN